MKKLLFFLFFVLLSSLVFGKGTCSLNKDTYGFGENALFSCGCTLGNEKDVVGTFVWRNSSGTVLQNTTTNSGSCQTSFFTSSFMLPSYNTTINATFETSNINWQDGDDVVFDTLILSSGIGCKINDFSTTQNPNLGATLSLKSRLSDLETNRSILDGHCRVSILDINRIPISAKPTVSDTHQAVHSTANGYVYLNILLDDEIFIPENTYLIEYSCYCTPSGTDEECYDQLTGANFLDLNGVRTCTGETTFKTGVDRRGKDKDYTGLSILLIGTMFILFLIMTSLKSEREDGSLVPINTLLKTTVGGFLIFFIFLMIQISYSMSLTLGANSIIDVNLRSLYDVSTWFFIIVLFLLLFGIGGNLILKAFNAVGKRR